MSLCCERLSTFIKRAKARGDLHGIQVCIGSPTLSHILFVDNCFLFFRVEEKESRCIKEIRNTYEEASGQFVNIASQKFILAGIQLWSIEKR